MATCTCPTGGVPMEEGAREKRRNLHGGAARGKALAMVITNTSGSLPSTTIPHTRSPDELVSIHIDRGAFQPIPLHASSHLQVGPRLRHAARAPFLSSLASRTFHPLHIFRRKQELPSIPHLAQATASVRLVRCSSSLRSAETKRCISWPSLLGVSSPVVTNRHRRASAFADACRERKLAHASDAFVRVRFVFEERRDLQEGAGRERKEEASEIALRGRVPASLRHERDATTTADNERRRRRRRCDER